MKKIFALIIACALMLCVFVACDKNEDPTEKPTTAPTEAPTSAPTEGPTSAPTSAPTAAPTEAPTSAPTEAPTSAPTEAPTSAPTEAPTSAPTEAPDEIDLEEIEETLLAANKYIDDNPNFKVDVITETVYDDAMMEETEDGPTIERETVIFTADGYMSELRSSDGNFDIYTLVNGVLYNYYSMEGEEYKEKTILSDEGYADELFYERVQYVYGSELSMFEDVEVTENEDGGVTYILRGWTPTESEDDAFSDMITNMAISITLDAEGRFASISTVVEMSIDLVIMTFDTTSMNTVTYTYYDEGELEITEPEDADEYEEYVEEEWSCDCGASSWEDCVCETEWSCDCGASSWEDCVCEYEWSCDCGATSWEDCICE